MYFKKCWDSLTDEERTIIQEEFDKGAEDNLTETKKLEDEYAQKLKDNGVTFHEVDAEAFNKAVAPVYEKFPKWTPGIYDKIMENLTQIREDIKNGK
ncbi:C4-dicarboxylate-binding protein [Fusobacterium animalis ATCC 51191]|uniref:C4-dicarboxylate-binding protein n=1 Tax=Fusobacterium animalis ATCC 51191 TaxID=997347 RepID=F9ELZ0_9FUSO|nr:C4-dicarboxylate-binding protein [Fusobacterium animalis ATCC 51191]